MHVCVQIDTCETPEAAAHTHCSSSDEPELLDDHSTQSDLPMDKKDIGCNMI